jgi:hypothetical protein
MAVGGGGGLAGAASELTLDLEALKAKIADLRSSVQVKARSLSSTPAHGRFAPRRRLASAVPTAAARLLKSGDSGPRGFPPSSPTWCRAARSLIAFRHPPACERPPSSTRLPGRLPSLSSCARGDTPRLIGGGRRRAGLRGGAGHSPGHVPAGPPFSSSHPTHPATCRPPHVKLLLPPALSSHRTISPDQPMLLLCYFNPLVYLCCPGI